MSVAVVGAGIAGLSAAWELTRAGGEVTVLDSERRVGGVVVTERRDGFIIEGGPDGWLAAEAHLPALAEELGIASHVVRQAAKGSLLWNGTAFGDFEQGLNSAVNVVRKNLSDSADQPRYIETVPGHGYRFIAPLRSAVAVQEQPGV